MFVQQEILGMIFCSEFDGNTAPSGAAINLAYYNARMDNVSFRNHHGSAIRVSNHHYILCDGLANKLDIKPNPIVLHEVVSIQLATIIII